MRRVGLAVLGLLLLASGAVALLVATIDPNEHKAAIEAWASEALGHTVRIEGPIELTRSLTPSLVVNDLRVSGAGQAMVSIDRGELSVVLTSLLFGPLHLPRIAIDTARLDLPLEGWSSRGRTGAVPRIDQIALSNISIRYRTGDDATLDLVVERATLAPTADQTTLEMTGTLDTLPLEVSGTMGAVEALFATGKDWPLSVDATLGDGQIKVAGNLGLTSGQLAYQIDVKADLPASATLAASLGLPALPLEAAAKVQASDGTVAVQGLSATSGNSDLSGDLTWREGPRAKLSAKLAAKRVDLVELGLTGTGAKSGQASDALVPNLPLPGPAQIPFDLDLDAKVGRLDLPGEQLTDLALTASAGPEQLELGLAQAKIGGGQVQGSYRSGKASAVGVKLDARGLDLARLFGDPGGGTKLPKDVAMKADLTGHGADLHAFLGSANGPIAISAGAALLDDAFASLLGRSLFTAIIPDFEPSHGAHIVCSVLDLEAKDGKARSTALVIDGKRVVIGGGGAIDLATGQIDFMLIPKAKTAVLAPLVTPVHLAGTIADPKVMGDATDLLDSTGNLLLGIVNPLSLATPVLFPDRGGDMPCRDPAIAQESDPIQSVGGTAIDAVTDTAKGVGSAIEDIGKGASDLLDDVIGR